MGVQRQHLVQCILIGHERKGRKRAGIGRDDKFVKGGKTRHQSRIALVNPLSVGYPTSLRGPDIRRIARAEKRIIRAQGAVRTRQGQVAAGRGGRQDPVTEENRIAHPNRTL